uniref:Assembly factor for spindle microtubules n=1 Tax=Gasterosteus aculeatus aculeatus TaxID=481459 RepID=G3NR41_GASAC
MAETESSTRRGVLDFSPVKSDNANKENEVPVLILTLFSKAPFVSFGTVKLGTSKSVLLRIENPTRDSEAEVTVERIPSRSLRLFTASPRCVLQPEDSFGLTVTWTPSEEGAIRELILFSANGVLKLQAVLLGRAEAPKKKKKSLWDTIKNKRDGEKVTAPRRKKTEQPLKMSANKTFQVSRKPQYKREKPRSPLASLNEGKVVRQRSFSKLGPLDDYSQKPASNSTERQRPGGSLDQENVRPVQRNSPLVLIILWRRSSRFYLKPHTYSSASPSFLSAIPRHPMPFAAQNMFYDERWIEKQERGFTWWLNYVLTPDDFRVNTEVAKVNAVTLVLGGDGDTYSVPKAPTKEEMSFSTYTARRKLNRLRRAACQLFASEALVKAIQRLELEVEAKRLLVRKDRHLWKDIGERRKLLHWLLSYNPLWLRIGLETIFGELISLESNSDALGLALFILQRLLWNPDIAAQFRHAKVPHLYRDGHEEALSRFTLKKLLLLVCFLDKAKEARLIEHDPCLFCLDAEFKTSRDLLLAFSRDFLSGEGILPRHLGYMGLPVSHVQRPLDEFNFAVKNLAVDLKCGIRLVRVMELLIQDWSLSAKLRLPAISRLQKVHNVDVSLQVLKSKGVDLKDEHGSSIDSRDIVDGHREKTLSLLWKIIFAFHVILDEDQLRDEIGFLKRSLRTKRRLASLRADRGLRPSPSKARAPYEHGSTKITLLMDWVRAVCDFYNLKVENFTVTFSDGRVLCYLIHHYHPGLLPERAVSHRTTQTVECSQRGRLELNCSASDSDSSFDSPPPDLPSVEFKELLENEKNNFGLVNAAVSFLGGVPAMINPADMSNTIPNDKVVMSYLSFLCARLLDLRNESRAARVIQGAWRKYRLKKHLQLYEERNTAAMKIQLVVRSFLQKRRAKRQKEAAAVIQAVWRGFVARNRLRLQKQAHLRALQHQAATLIQTQWRMFRAWRAYRRLSYYAIVVQSQWRMRRAAAVYGRIRWAVAVIQKQSRAWAVAKRDREQYLSLRAAVVKIQEGYRRWKTRKTEKENRAAGVIQAAFKKWYQQKMSARTAAAVKIQSWYRMLMSLHQYRKIQRSTALIQAHCRGHAQRRPCAVVVQRHYRAHAAGKEARKAYLRTRAACVALQAAFRGMRVRAELKQRHRAATVVQASVRMAQRKAYGALKQATVKIQAAHRGRRDRRALKKRHKAAGAIQAQFRMHRMRMAFLATKCAAIMVQERYRAKMLRNRQMQMYRTMKSAVVTIQAAYRGYRARSEVAEMHRAATVIQRKFLAIRGRNQFLALKAAALVIQRRRRAVTLGRKERLDYLSKRTAVICLQAAHRGRRVRKQLRMMHSAAVTIQSHFRKHQHRTYYKNLQWAAAVLQASYRAKKEMRKEMQSLNAKRKAAVVLQAALRGMKSRRLFKRRHHAASVIQRAFRAHSQCKQYLTLRSSVLTIQQRYRATAAARVQMHEYQSMRRAAVVLQAAFRGRQVRKQVAGWHQAATVIQSAFRKHREEVKFRAMRLSAVIIQRYYRACVLQRQQRGKFLKTKQSAVTIQAAFRGHRVRTNMALMHRAAAVIQANFKRHKQQSAFRKLLWAACVLQRRFRAQRLRNAEVKHYQQCRRAAVVFQAAYRGMKLRQEIKRRHQAASVIQRAFRAHSQCKQYLTLRSSVLTIQQRYRATAAARVQMHEYQSMRRAAVVLQAAFRGRQVRKQVAGWHQAATVIQSAFRKHREEVKFRAMRLSAVIIQRYYRACVLQRQQRGKFLKTKQSAVTIQAAFRGHCVRTNMALMHRAAAVIQANFKRHKQQSAFRKLLWAACVLQRRFRAQRLRNAEMKHYQEVKEAVTNLQAAFRGMKSRRMIKQRHRAACDLQRAYRAFCKRKQYLQLKLSVITIQRRYRAAVAAKAQRKRYQEMLCAAVVLQAAFRGRQVRKQVAGWHQAATVIQSAFRKHREEVKFRAMRLSAVIIQRYYRACVLQRQQRGKFLKTKQSAVTIQAAFRGWCLRMDIRRQNHAATVIQSCWKCSVQRRSFQRTRETAVKLQRRFRAVRERNSYARKREAATTLQKHCRAWIERHKVIGLMWAQKTGKHEVTVLCILLPFQEQQRARAKRRLCFTAAVFHHLRAIKIQRALRAHWARESAKRKLPPSITIQGQGPALSQSHFLQCSLILNSFVFFSFCSLSLLLSLQALWRGHRSRRLNDDAKLQKIRHRLRKVSAGVQEEDKLCNKTSSALDYLLRYKHFSYILEALRKLETATRLSPECCERLAESGATDVIFTLIRCCNRSVPCMDVITYSIQILLNLSKYHKTIEAVYLVENFVETLLDLLQRYREKAGDKVAEKGGSIFTKACFLLALHLQDEHRAAEVMKLPKVLDRLRSIYRLTARKHKMDAERTIMKQKMNASINGSFFVQATPPVIDVPSLLFRFAPDWVLRKDKLKDIVDPLRAIEMVAKTLCIVL